MTTGGHSTCRLDVMCLFLLIYGYRITISEPVFMISTSPYDASALCWKAQVCEGEGPCGLLVSMISRRLLHRLPFFLVLSGHTTHMLCRLWICTPTTLVARDR